MGLPEALVMQRVEANRTIRRIDPFLERKYSDAEAKKTVATDLNAVSIKHRQKEQNIDFDLRETENESIKCQVIKSSKKLNAEESMNVQTKTLSQSAHKSENIIRKDSSYSKDDEINLQENKYLNMERENIACDDKVKGINAVSKSLNTINSNEQRTTGGAKQQETPECAASGKDERRNISKEEEVEIPVDSAIKHPAFKKGEEKSKEDPEVEMLQKTLLQIQIGDKPKQNIAKHLKTLQKLLLKVKINEPTSADASKRNFKSLHDYDNDYTEEEKEEGLVERSPVQQSFVNAPLQSGSTVIESTSQLPSSDALLNILDDNFDWNMLTDVETDVMNLYRTHPELFDGVLDFCEQDRISITEIAGSRNDIPDSVLPEPVAMMNSEISNSPQAAFLTSQQSDFSPASSPNAYPEHLQYVPSTPNAPSLASSITSPPSLFHPDSPQSIQNHEFEKLYTITSENVIYNSTQCNMEANILGNAVNVSSVENTASECVVTSTMNSLPFTDNYLSKSSEMNSLLTWLNEESSNNLSSKTNVGVSHQLADVDVCQQSLNIGGSQQHVLYVEIAQTAETISQADGFLSANNSFSSSKSNGGVRNVDSIKKAPSIPSTIPISAKSRLEEILNPKLKVDAIINIWKIGDIEIAQGDEHGDTQLMILVSRPVSGQYELVHALVERLKNMPGSPMEAVNKFGESALLLSSVLLPSHPLIARYIAETLLEKGSYLDKVDSCRKSPIHYLAENGHTHLEVLRELLSLRDAANLPCFDINRRCEEGTPLHVAVKSHHTKTAQDKEMINSCSTVLFLVDQGADVNAKDNQGQTVLHLAIRGACDPCLVQMLLRVSPQLVNVQDNNGDTPLHCAAMRNDVPITRQAHVVKLLINVGACRNIIGSNGRVPLGLISPERKHDIGNIFHRR